MRHRRHEGLRRRLATAAGAVALVVGPVAAPAAADSAVVIAPGAVQPPTLTASVGERIAFVNRTGRAVHLEFDAIPAGHRVYEVSGEIWAVFHRPGRHPYVVHFLAGRGGDVRGAVEVREDPATGPQTCPGLLTVMGECLEP
jgi:plastocyanin